MPAWRVTYLPEPGTGKARPQTVVIEDPQSSTLDGFALRLSSGALGSEWTHGRAILSVEGVEYVQRRHRRIALTAAGALVIALGIVLIGFVVPIPHSWSFVLASSGMCPNGCSNQVVVQSFPKGAEVSGTWSSPSPSGLLISTASGLVCPVGGISSGPDSCSQNWVTSGSFDFTSVGGNVSFVADSADPENLTVSGTWSQVAW